MEVFFMKEIDIEKEFEAVKDKTTEEKLAYFTQYVVDKTVEELKGDISEEDANALIEESVKLIAEYKKTHNIQ